MSNHLEFKKKKILSLYLKHNDFLSIVTRGEDYLLGIEGQNSSQIRSIVLDMLYGILRNHLWLDHSLFRDCLQQFMIETYRMDRKICDELITLLMDQVSQVMSIPTFERFKQGDENFITYLFVQTMNLSKKDDLVEDLGLGTSILNKMNRAAEYFSKNEISDQNRFMVETDDDMIFHTVLEKISQYKVKYPWYLDSLLLLFKLDKLSHNWQRYFWDQGAYSLTELLYLIGHKSIVTKAKAKSWLIKNLSKSSEWKTSHLDHLIDYLVSENIVYLSHCSADGKASSKKKYIDLCPDGYQLSSRRFVSSQTFEHLIPYHVISLASHWQLQLLKKFSKVFDDFELTKKYMSLPLAPESIEYLLSLIAEENQEEILNTCPQNIKSMVSPGRRLGFYRGISNFSNTEMSFDVLMNAVQKDSSLHVRETVSELLNR